VFVLKKILSSLFLPPFGLILLAAFGLCWSIRHPRAGRTLAFLALVLLAAGSLPLVSTALIAGLEQLPPIAPTELARAQAIVILGAGTYPAAPEYGGDTVSATALERLRYGVYLQQKSGLPILVSGGSVYGERPEAEAMKEAVERDLHGRVRWSEARARDTVDNARFSADILKNAGVTRVALVSHAWHLPRAVEQFERQGLTVFAAPMGYHTHMASTMTPLLPSAASLNTASIAVHERLGRLVQH